MSTAELIAALRQADPSGAREVWLEVPARHATYTDLAGSVRVDEVGDLVISSEEEL